jgi:peroxiredoxin
MHTCMHSTKPRSDGLALKNYSMDCVSVRCPLSKKNWIMEESLQTVSDNRETLLTFQTNLGHVLVLATLILLVKGTTTRQSSRTRATRHVIIRDLSLAFFVYLSLNSWAHA